MKEVIIEKLHALESENDIEILYACESGSRAWGFSNDMSDYDVRFIYRKINVKDYLTLRKDSDVIEDSDGLYDIVGWDIKKALTLHYRNNPTLREWLMSDEVYIDRGINNIFRGLGGFDPDILMNHYIALSKKDYRKYCTEGFNPKKYLYVARAILSAMMLERGICPPLNIFEIMDKSEISDRIKGDIISLIDYHQNRSEISGSSLQRLDAFFECSFHSLKPVNDIKKKKDFEKYEERFREVLLLR